jgi:putative transposase
MIRGGAGMPVSRFCLLVDIPRRTYCRIQRQLKSGTPTTKGPWPSTSLDAVANVLEDYLRRYEHLGHRKIHALILADGHVTSPSTVLRGIRRLEESPCGKPG